MSLASRVRAQDIHFLLSQAVCTRTLSHITHNWQRRQRERAYVALCTRCAHTHTLTLALTHTHIYTQLVAKTKTAYVELQRQFAKRLIEKEYHALVEGCVDGEEVKGSRD